MDEFIRKDDVLEVILGVSMNYHLLRGRKEPKEGFVRSLIKGIETMSSKRDQWIPVSERSPERLPEAADLGVLVTAVNGWEQKTVFKAFMGYGDFKWYTSDALIQPDKNNVVPEHWKIIAWMPLPEPYGEESWEEEDDCIA